MTETEVVLTDLIKLKPKNWQELSDAGKFLRHYYGQSFSAAVSAVEDILKSAEITEGDFVELQSQVRNFSKFESCRDQANFFYLGAKAAAKECSKGDFSNDLEVARRAFDVNDAGVLIAYFVRAANGITSTNVLLTDEQKSLKPVIAIQSLAAESIFDESRNLRASILDHGYYLPKPSTVVEVVTEEEGVMPEFVRKILLDGLSPKQSLLC